MKEAFEDRITRRIREVMEQYEPEYSPQAWKDFRKHKRRREFWLTRFFLKYRYRLTVIIITGMLIVIFRGLSPTVPEKENIVISNSSGSANSPESEKKVGIPIGEKPSIVSHSDSKANTSTRKENISFNYLPVRINDTLPSNYVYKVQVENEIAVIPDSIELVASGSDLLYKEPLRPRLNMSQLKTSDLKSIKVPELTSHISDRTRKNKLQLPDFSGLTTKSNNYRKFTGPNKFALFFSAEIHRSDSIRTFGTSRGFGFIIEGPVRSFISISAGLSFQSMNFNKTLSTGHVPDYLPPQYVPYVEYIIVRSGSYRYLELPVSVNLRFLKGARPQVWIGAGISSMAFLRQTYTYEIAIIDDIYKVDIFANALKNIHPVASMNFGLTYRFRVTDRLFLNSAIQYKLHLVPLGYNSIKLNRLNLQIGLGYRFGRYD